MCRAAVSLSSWLHTLEATSPYLSLRLFLRLVTIVVLSYNSARLSQPRLLYLGLSDGPVVWVEII